MSKFQLSSDARVGAEAPTPWMPRYEWSNRTFSPPKGGLNTTMHIVDTNYEIYDAIVHAVRKIGGVETCYKISRYQLEIKIGKLWSHLEADLLSVKEVVGSRMNEMITTTRTREQKRAEDKDVDYEDDERPKKKKSRLEDDDDDDFSFGAPG